MELRQLRYFVAVADELHFGRAAQRLHMSQPPLSAQIARLEDEIGTPLLVRSTRRVALTPAGGHLLLRARAVLDDLDALRDELGEFAGGLAGSLSAGFVSSANYTVLPEVVRLFRARRPRVALSLVPLTSGEQMARIRDGALDVGIVRDDATASSDLIADVVYEERLVACLPVDHPLASRSDVSPEEIAELPMIAYPAALMPGFVARVDAVFADVARRGGVVEEVVHQETALGFVAAGVGTSILPESVRHSVPASIAVIPLTGSPTTQLMAIRRADGRSGAAAETFVELLREVAAALGPASAATAHS